VNSNIFREYDIRGTVGVDLDNDTARAIGRAIGTTIRRGGGRSVAVGRDCRLSSDDLLAGLTEGILSTGTDVLDIGLSTTPLLYFAVFSEPVDGGVMITGSHNPPDMNGFKIMVGKETIHGKGIKNLLGLIQAGDFESGGGSSNGKNIIPAYRDQLTSSVKVNGNLRVGADFGNGTGAITTMPVLDVFGCSISALYPDPDGRFPNHHPDPTVVSNLEDLRELVLSEKLDLGVAYDGDADRIGVVDDRGNVIFGDMLLTLYARALLKEKPGAAVIGEVKCSQRMYNDIEARGGRPIMWKTGHSLIKDKLKTEDAMLAGEMSGHIFFRDRYFGFDDACYATLRLLEILSDGSGVPLSERLADLPPAVSTPEIRVDCPDDLKFQVVSEAVDYFGKRYKTLTVDGVRILFDEGWGLIRVSNTQPVIVLRFEASSDRNLREYRREVTDFLDAKGVKVPKDV